MSESSYLGARVEVWSGGGSWFWRVLALQRDGGTVGVAASEADAVRDARAAIELAHGDCAPRRKEA